MRCKTIKLMTVVCAGVCLLTLAPQVGADSTPCTVDYTWERPCVDGMTCLGGPPCNCGQEISCWCEGDWNDCDMWHGVISGNCDGVPIPCYPLSGSHDAFIEASHAGTDESALQINLIDEWIDYLEIKTEDIGQSDELTVRFDSTAGGPKTLTVNSVVLDATNGDLTLVVADDTNLKTNTND